MAKGRKNRGKKQGISKKWGWALVALATAVFASIAWWPADSKMRISDEPALLIQGKELYVKNCAICHGAEAQGQDVTRHMGGMREDGTYIAPGLNGKAHSWHHPPDLLFRIVKFGSPAPNSPMVGWQGKMSDGEIQAVLSYLQSMWPEQLRQEYRRQHAMN